MRVMTQWEYYHLYFAASPRTGEKQGWSWEEARDANWSLIETFNQLGARRWELVQILEYASGRSYYFKREKTDEAD